MTVYVILAAVIAKGAARDVAARVMGLSKAKSLAIGGLINSRGLIELILLNIGLDAGFVTPAFFTILGLMASVATLMTAPLFDLALRRGSSIALAGEMRAVIDGLCWG